MKQFLEDGHKKKGGRYDLPIAVESLGKLSRSTGDVSITTTYVKATAGKVNIYTTGFKEVLENKASKPITWDARDIPSPIHELLFQKD